MNKIQHDFCYNVSNLTLVTVSAFNTVSPIYHCAPWRIEPRLEQIYDELISVIRKFGEVQFHGACCHKVVGEMNLLFSVSFPDKRSERLFKLQHSDAWRKVKEGIDIHQRFLKKPDDPNLQYRGSGDFDVEVDYI